MGKRRTGVAVIEALDFGRYAVMVDGHVKWAGPSIDVARVLCNDHNRVYAVVREFEDQKLRRAIDALTKGV